MEVECDDGRIIEGDGAEAYVNEQFAREAYLVQPLLTDHPSLKVINHLDDVCVVRVITERSQQGLRFWSVFLEVPFCFGRGKGVLVVPVMEQDGRLGIPLPLWSNKVPPAEWRKASGMILPCWAEVVRVAKEAHGRIVELDSVAWDFIITPQGPLLLEGNLHWDTVMPQRIMGGVLAQAGFHCAN